MSLHRLAIVLALSLAALVLLASTATALSVAPVKTVKVGAAKDGKTVTLRKGDKLVVSLAGNATTGYEWQVKSVKRKVLSLSASKYVPDKNPSGVVGAGGVYKLTFHAAAKGQTTLRLIYARDFGPPDDDPDIFTLRVVVK